MEILYHANRVYLWCAFESNHIVVPIGSMNTRRNAARRHEGEVAIVVASPHDEQALPLEENANIDHASSNPPPMTEVEMRSIRD